LQLRVLRGGRRSERLRRRRRRWAELTQRAGAPEPLERHRVEREPEVQRPPQVVGPAGFARAVVVVGAALVVAAERPVVAAGWSRS
jgi:hypothetical protein